MELTSNVVQTVNVNGNVVFITTRIPGNCSVIHTEGSGNIKMRGLSNNQCRSRFKVTFTGNIAVPTGGTAGAISLTITIDGEAVRTAQMIVTPAAVEQYFNVASCVYIDVPTGCCSTAGVTNTSDQTINVQNANLIVERVA